MPLDGHAYLLSQGWSGKGTGLRQGAIERPIAIPQKRTLAGLGKDRDEAFPFWDHLFTAAAKSIKVKIHNDSDDSDHDDSGSVLLGSNENDVKNGMSLKYNRTITGILSNKRPTIGISASTGTSTPSDDASSFTQSYGPKLSLLAMAKRQAAKQRLYAGFYRGPLLGPDGPTEVLVVTDDVTESDTEGIKKRKKKLCKDTTKMKNDTVVFSAKTKFEEKVKNKKKKGKVAEFPICEEDFSLTKKKKKRKHEIDTEYPEEDVNSESRKKKSRRSKDIPNELHRGDDEKKRKKSKQKSGSVTSDLVEIQDSSRECNQDSRIEPSSSPDVKLKRKLKRLKRKEEKAKAAIS